MWRIIAYAMVAYFVDIAKFTLLHPFLMDGFYWTIISMWVKLIHNSMDLHGIQNDLRGQGGVQGQNFEFSWLEYILKFGLWGSKCF